MLYLLTGQDDYSLKESLEGIRNKFILPTLVEANTTVLDGQKLTMEQLRSIVETVPFMAEKRLVIINGLLERFESKAKSIGKKKVRTTTRLQESYQQLADYLRKIPDSSVVVLVDREIKSSNPLFNELAGKMEVRSFPLMKGAKLKQWIKRRVATKGGSISLQAIDLLAKMIGGNLWIMANEIDKLVLFTSGRCIEEADVNNSVNYTQQTNVFAMIDAILKSQAGVAEQMLQQLLQEGYNTTYLLVMLSRQIRLIILARGLLDHKKSNIEVQKKLGITAEFAFQKIMGQASRYSLRRLKEVYNQLLEADLSIKTGKYDGELALDTLIITLSQI